jgi:hypothetical protein
MHRGFAKPHEGPSDHADRIRGHVVCTSEVRRPAHRAQSIAFFFRGKFLPVAGIGPWAPPLQNQKNRKFHKFLNRKFKARCGNIFESQNIRSSFPKWEENGGNVESERGLPPRGHVGRAQSSSMMRDSLPKTSKSSRPLWVQARGCKPQGLVPQGYVESD